MTIGLVHLKAAFFCVEARGFLTANYHISFLLGSLVQCTCISEMAAAAVFLVLWSTSSVGSDGSEHVRSLIITYTTLEPLVQCLFWTCEFLCKAKHALNACLIWVFLISAWSLEWENVQSHMNFWLDFGPPYRALLNSRCSKLIKSPLDTSLVFGSMAKGGDGKEEWQRLPINSS